MKTNWSLRFQSSLGRNHKTVPASCISSLVFYGKLPHNWKPIDGMIVGGQLLCRFKPYRQWQLLPNNNMICGRVHSCAEWMGLGDQFRLLDEIICFCSVTLTFVFWTTITLLAGRVFLNYWIDCSEEIYGEEHCYTQTFLISDLRSWHSVTLCCIGDVFMSNIRSQRVCMEETSGCESRAKEGCTDRNNGISLFFALGPPKSNLCRKGFHVCRQNRRPSLPVMCGMQMFDNTFRSWQD